MVKTRVVQKKKCILMPRGGGVGTDSWHTDTWHREEAAARHYGPGM